MCTHFRIWNFFPKDKTNIFKSASRFQHLPLADFPCLVAREVWSWLGSSWYCPGHDWGLAKRHGGLDAAPEAFQAGYSHIIYICIFLFMDFFCQWEWAKNKNNPMNHFVSITSFSWGTCCKHQWGNTCYSQLRCSQSSSRGCSICQQKDGGTADGSKWGWNSSDPDLPNIHLQNENPLFGWILPHQGLQWSWGSCWPAMSTGVWPKEQTWISDQYRLWYVNFFWVWWVNQIIGWLDLGFWEPLLSPAFFPLLRMLGMDGPWCTRYVSWPLPAIPMPKRFSSGCGSHAIFTKFDAMSMKQL